MNDQIIKELVDSCNNLDDDIKFTKEIKNIVNYISYVFNVNQFKTLDREFILECVNDFKINNNVENIQFDVNVENPIEIKHNIGTLKFIILKMLENAFVHNDDNNDIIYINVYENKTIEVCNVICKNLSCNYIDLSFNDELKDEFNIDSHCKDTILSTKISLCH